MENHKSDRLFVWKRLLKPQVNTINHELIFLLAERRQARVRFIFLGRFEIKKCERWLEWTQLDSPRDDEMKCDVMMDRERCVREIHQSILINISLLLLTSISLKSYLFKRFFCNDDEKRTLIISFYTLLIKLILLRKIKISLKKKD